MNTASHPDRVTLIIRTPHLGVGYQTFLANLGLQEDDILLEIIKILTPDGTEQRYYEKFDDVIPILKIAPASAEYLNVYKTASELYIYVLDQIHHNPMVNLIMGASIVSFVRHHDAIFLGLDYSTDYDMYER